MSKMIINLRAGINKDNFKNGDMLVYDATKKEFYVVTEETFFDKTNARINELVKRYDSKVEKIEKEKEEIEQKTNEFMLKIQESNKKLIDMVDNFIKGGK